MTKTIWTILGSMMAASLIAQDNTNLPAIPAPVSSPAAETAPAPEQEMSAPSTPAPTPPKHKRKHHPVAKHATHAAPEATVSLTPGPAEVNATELVVRGQAGLRGELVTHLHKGDTVTVLDQINLAHHSSDEPAQWAKIAYPTNGGVWVSAKYIDASGAVKSKKLNLRAGPSEDYSVVGVLDQGTSVSQIETKGDWMKIQPPTNAFAFVAAKYLTQEAVAMQSPSGPSGEAPEVPPTPTQVPEQPPVVVNPPPMMTPPPPPQPTTPSVRIVQHEGVIGPVGSMIAPTDFKLYDPNTGQDIDFLYPISGNVDLKSLLDARVIVTGEEGIDSRWPNTPVIAIQSIQVLQTNVIKRLDLTQPRQRH